MRKKYPPDKSLGETKLNAYTIALEGSRALQVIESYLLIFDPISMRDKIFNLIIYANITKKRNLKSLRLIKNLPRNDLLSDISDVFY